jgi:hypothetical protein
MEKIESVAFSYKTTLFDLRQHLKTVADCKTKKIKKKILGIGRHTAVGASGIWTLHCRWRVQSVDATLPMAHPRHKEK